MAGRLLEKGSGSRFGTEAALTPPLGTLLQTPPRRAHLALLREILGSRTTRIIESSDESDRHGTGSLPVS
jgi:hypothetical protein